MYHANSPYPNRTGASPAMYEAYTPNIAIETYLNLGGIFHENMEKLLYRLSYVLGYSTTKLRDFIRCDLSSNRPHVIFYKSSNLELRIRSVSAAFSLSL